MLLIASAPVFSNCQMFCLAITFYFDSILNVSFDIQYFSYLPFLEILLILTLFSFPFCNLSIHRTSLINFALVSLTSLFLLGLSILQCQSEPLDTSCWTAHSFLFPSFLFITVFLPLLLPRQSLSGPKPLLAAVASENCKRDSVNVQGLMVSTEWKTSAFRLNARWNEKCEWQPKWFESELLLASSDQQRLINSLLSRPAVSVMVERHEAKDMIN